MSGSCQLIAYARKDSKSRLVYSIENPVMIDKKTKL